MLLEEDKFITTGKMSVLYLSEIVLEDLHNFVQKRQDRGCVTIRL